jgi:hypothetical protein
MRWLPCPSLLQDNPMLGKLVDWLNAHADDTQRFSDWMHSHLRLPTVMVNGQPLTLPTFGERFPSFPPASLYPLLCATARPNLHTFSLLCRRDSGPPWPR